jgi:hypothetical protein
MFSCKDAQYFGWIKFLHNKNYDFQKNDTSKRAEENKILAIKGKLLNPHLHDKSKIEEELIFFIN